MKHPRIALYAAMILTASCAAMCLWMLTPFGAGGALDVMTILALAGLHALMALCCALSVAYAREVARHPYPDSALVASGAGVTVVAVALISAAVALSSDVIDVMPMRYGVAPQLMLAWVGTLWLPMLVLFTLRITSRER